jgi:nucleoside-diphosphate-sugar epimerase
MTHLLHVTGCAGFVGQALCAELQRRSTLAFSGSDRGSCPGNFSAWHKPRIVVDDIGPDTDWSQALEGADTVIHLAARAHVLREDSDDPLREFRRVNRDGTLSLARQAAARGVRRFVFMSSIGVHGEQTAGADWKSEAGRLNKPFSEADTPRPHSDYAIAKWEAEQGLVEIARKSGMELVILRAPLVYGPGMKGNFARLVRLIDLGLPLPLGSVQNQRSFLAVSNLIDLLIRCVVEPAAGNQLFVVADGAEVSTPDLVRRIARALSKPARLLPVPVGLLWMGAVCLGQQKLFQQLCGSLVVDATKVRRVLAWTPPVTMEQELALVTDSIKK